MIQAIILAAGKSRRMAGEGSKVLMPINGIPIIQRVVQTVHRSGLGHPMIVINPEGKDIQELLGRDYRYIIQQEPLGTGHAVASAKYALKNKADHVLVLYGDHPFISVETVRKLIEQHESNGATLTLATYRCLNFEGDNYILNDFGRILRNENGQIIGNREVKDCTDEERKITEVSPAYFVFRADWLWDNIDKLQNKNVQKEYYLPDLVALAVRQNEPITSYTSTNTVEALGINTPQQLQTAQRIAKKHL